MDSPGMAIAIFASDQVWPGNQNFEQVRNCQRYLHSAKSKNGSVVNFHQAFEIWLCPTVSKLCPEHSLINESGDQSSI